MKSVCLLIILSLLLGSCKSSFPVHETEKTVFRYNESKGITTLDPAFARNQTLIWPVNQLYCGLVQLDDNLNIRPLIAHNWNISADGLTYTFYLRNDVFFHDNECFYENQGRKVVSHDFVYSFTRIQDPSLASPGRWIFNQVAADEKGQINGFIPVNDSTLVIRLKKAFPPFLGMLSMPYCFVVPHEATEKYKTDFGRNPVGCGPFRFHSWKEDEKLIFLKNKDYFEKDSTGNPLPYLDAVSITFIKDKQSEFLEFLKGNIDFLSGVHPIYKDELLTRSGNLNSQYRDNYLLNKQAYLNTEYLGFLLDATKTDSSSNPLLNKDVRKAINYGFDRTKMMKYLRNNVGVPAHSGFIPVGIPSFSSDLSGYSYNPDTAKFFLKKAGYPNGKGLPEIILTTTSDYLDLCEFIQYELFGLGIRIKIDVATGASFRNKVANSNLTFFRGSWIADYPDGENYLLLFLSENFSPQGPNYTHFSNIDYDSLYYRAILTVEDHKRFEIYRKMDSILIEEAVIVPLYYDQVARFTRKNIQGLGSNPMNLLVLKNVTVIN